MNGFTLIFARTQVHMQDGRIGLRSCPKLDKLDRGRGATLPGRGATDSTPAGAGGLVAEPGDAANAASVPPTRHLQTGVRHIDRAK